MFDFVVAAGRAATWVVQHVGFPVVQVTPTPHQSQSRDRRSRCQGPIHRDYTIISAHLCFSVTVVFSHVHCVPYIFHCVPYLFVSGMLRYCSTTRSGGLWYQWGGNRGRDLNQLFWSQWSQIYATIQRKMRVCLHTLIHCYHHQLNVHFLPRLIKGVGGCFQQHKVDNQLLATLPFLDFSFSYSNSFIWIYLFFPNCFTILIVFTSGFFTWFHDSLFKTHFSIQFKFI